MIFPIVLLLAALQATTAQRVPNFSPTGQFQEDDIGISSRYSYFDLELLKAFGDDANYVISPASIKVTLAMLFEGAQGLTAQEISNRLRLSQSNGRNELQDTLSALAAKNGTTIFDSANAFYVATGFNVLQEYKEKLRQFNTEVQPVNFNSENAVSIINDWVRHVTKNRITEIVNAGNLGPETKLIIANALYFKGTWKNEFDERNTKTECFFIANGECHNVRMMQSINTYKYKYISDLDARAVELPYSGDEYAMLLLVPDQRNTVEALKKDMQHQKFSSIIGVLEYSEVVVKLPKFQISFNGDIVEALKVMEIQEIFGNNANLSGISPGNNLKVGNIFHKAKLEVNEKGTTAVAATGVIVIPLMGSSMERVIANRPFLFFIYHRSTKTIIFEGRYNMPDEVIEAPKPQQVSTRFDSQTTQPYYSNPSGSHFQNPTNSRPQQGNGFGSPDQSQASGNRQQTNFPYNGPSQLYPPTANQGNVNAAPHGPLYYNTPTKQNTNYNQHAARTV